MSSTRKGGVRSRKPKHQNTYGFKHNKNSKKTKKIKALPNVTLGLCPRCTEQIMWKIKYRKYKPVKQPGKWYVVFDHYAHIVRVVEVDVGCPLKVRDPQNLPLYRSLSRFTHSISFSCSFLC